MANIAPPGPPPAKKFKHFSRKGSVDERISDLVQFINGCDHYFTTSSCSGRICLFEEPEVSTRKKACSWLLITHDVCDWSVVVESMQKSVSGASLKFEPFVLHVQCASLSDAQTMHEVAVASGFRNSGLTVGKRGKIMANVRSTHSLEIPVTRNGFKIVSDEYVDYAVQLANSKMEENFNRINRFHDNLIKALDRNRVENVSAVERKSVRQNGDVQSSALRQQHCQVQPSARVILDNDCDDNVTCISLFDET